MHTASYIPFLSGLVAGISFCLAGLFTVFRSYGWVAFFATVTIAGAFVGLTA